MSTAIVFAGPVKDGKFSEMVITQMRAIAKLYRQELVDRIVATGGHGIRMVDGSPSEAQGIVRWFCENGVRCNDLICEDRSSSTLENIKNVVPQYLDSTNVVIADAPLFFKRRRIILDAWALKQKLSLSVWEVDSGYRPTALEVIKENMLFRLTKLDPTGDGFLWRALLSYRKFTRKVGFRLPFKD